MTGFNSKRDAAADKLQEPVCDKDPQGCWNVRCQLGKQCKNLAQPVQEQRPWVGLTPEDILDLFDEQNLYGSKLVEFARAVETKIKDKNT